MYDDNLINSEKNYLNEISALRDKMRDEEQKKHEKDLNYRLSRSRNYHSKQKILEDENHRRAMETYELQLEALEKKREEDFRNLKYYRELGTITDEQYYSELAALRDNYFEKGSEQWQKYTLEILDYEKKAVSEIASDIAKHATDSFSEVMELKEKFEKKLTSENTGLFGESTDTFKINGKVSKVTHTYLNNWEGEIYLMKKYRDALDSVKKRMGEVGFDGEVVKNFFGAMTELSFNDGVKFADMLGKLDTDEFKKYVSDYTEYFRLADEISAQMYADDMDAAYDGIIKNAREKFSELGVDIPEEFFETGVSGARKFSEGFLTNVKSFFNDLAQEISKFNSSLAAGINPGDITTNINNYESNITINGQGTTAQDINSYLAAQEVNRQRWG